MTKIVNLDLTVKGFNINGPLKFYLLFSSVIYLLVLTQVFGYLKLQKKVSLFHWTDFTICLPILRILLKGALLIIFLLQHLELLWITGVSVSKKSVSARTQICIQMIPTKQLRILMSALFFAYVFCYGADYALFGAICIKFVLSVVKMMLLFRKNLVRYNSTKV